MTSIEQEALRRYPPLGSYPTQDCDYNRMQAARREGFMEAAKSDILAEFRDMELETAARIADNYPTVVAQAIAALIRSKKSKHTAS